MVEGILRPRGATSARAARTVPAMSAARGRLRARRSAVLRRWRFMLAAATLLSGAAGYLVASSIHPRYESTGRVLVGPLGGEAKVLRASGPLAETYARLATTRRLLDATARRVGIRRAEVEVRAETNAVTRLLTLRVRGADGRLAARFANAHAATLGRLSTRPSAGSARAGRLMVVEPAVGDGRRIGASAPAIAALTAIAGLVSAVVLALLFDRTDDAVRSPEDVEAATGMPCVGVLTRGALRAARAGNGAVDAGAARSAAAQFGALAAKLGADRGHSLLLIALHGDPSAVAGSLAAALADQGSRVTVVGVGDRDGAASSIASDGGTANGSATRSAELELRDMRSRADVVVLHATRLERSPTTLSWARVADGTVLVAQRERTMAHELRATTDTLRLVGAPIVGTVLAETPRPLGG
jgi:capsular polysaccharide biosynthesis protein